MSDVSVIVIQVQLLVIIVLLANISIQASRRP